MRRIILSPGAKADIRSTVQWYERIDPTLAFRFKLETRATLRRILQYPYRFPIVNVVIRRADLNRFPYSIYYFLDMNSISVIGVVHERRDDSAWKDRGNG